MVFACGGRALLMQVAHPLVAAAVAQHSSYEQDPWLRLRRTLQVMGRLIFGSPPESQRRARSLMKLHGSISGRTAEGTEYRASEPALLAWVWATLVDTALVAFEQSRGPLGDAERNRYYDEQKLIAGACGVPGSSCPSTICDFEDYLERTVSEDLRVSRDAKEIAGAVLRPPLREPFGAFATGPLHLLTVGLLPASIRDGYGFSWSPAHEDLLQMWLLGTRRTNAVVPSRVRKAAVSLLRPVMSLAIAPPGS